MSREAEMFSNPGARYVTTGTLAGILEQWNRLSSRQKLTHFIRFEGESYSGDAVANLKAHVAS